MENKAIVPSGGGTVLPPETLEAALGIDDLRFQKLGFIMDDIWNKRGTKAESMLAIINNPDLTESEKVYLAYKLKERIDRYIAKKVPFVGTTIARQMQV